VKNPSRTAAWIKNIEFTIRGTTTTQASKIMLTPDESFPVTLPTEYARAEEVITINGSVTYTDIFRRKWRRKFVKLCVYRIMTWVSFKTGGHGDRPEVTFSNPEGIGWNDEEALGEEEEGKPN